MATDQSNCLQTRREDGGSPTLDSWGVNSEYGVLRDVLVGPVENFAPIENWKYNSSVRASKRAGKVVDKQLLVQQFGEMISAYKSAGVTVHTLPMDELTTFQIYARDSSFMTPYGAVVCQLANPRRRGEFATVLRFYLSKGIPIYDMVSAGNFEGGDFNIIEPGVVLIGYSDTRSEEISAKQIGGWLGQEGWEIKYAPIDGFYSHIDLMVCMLGEKLAAVCLETTAPDVVEWLKEKKIEIIPVNFTDTMNLGCNVMALGNDKVLSTAGSMDLNSKLRAQGFEVFAPELDMLTMNGGGVHCVAQPLRRDPV